MDSDDPEESSTGRLTSMCTLMSIATRHLAPDARSTGTQRHRPTLPDAHDREARDVRCQLTSRLFCCVILEMLSVDGLLRRKFEGPLSVLAQTSDFEEDPANPWRRGQERSERNAESPGGVRHV